MSLQLILGNSGSGKSHWLYESVIRASLSEPNRTFLVVVPEQFTLQTQQELIRLHPRKGILNIDVLSFQRLAYRVFEETGGENRVVLEDTGKSLLLRKVGIEEQDRLTTLRASLRKPGYISQLKSMISELAQYDVTSEKMDEILAHAKDKPRLYGKLKDVAVLYEGFQRKLQDKYITSEEVLDALNQVADRSRLLKDCIIALDGFTGFTPSQLKLLFSLMKLTSLMMVTITIDVRENIWKAGGKHELFYLSKKTIQGLLKLAKETGVEVKEPVVLNRQGEAKQKTRFGQSPALAFLEQHFLRYGRQKYPHQQEEISIHTARNIAGEAHFAARTITKMVREQNYRYRDIAIITGDIASYGDYVKKIFASYQIPVFIDETKVILLNPMIEFIRAALEVALSRYSYASIFRYLKTGLCGITGGEVDLLENYVLAVGIRGEKNWKQPFERTTRFFDEEKLIKCNELRAKVADPLTVFTGRVKGKHPAAWFTEALYDLLVSQNIQEQMEAYCESFEADQQMEKAKEYSQIYGIILELLDKVVDLLGEETLTLKEYIEILEAGFGEAKVGNIPPVADQVLVGDMERTRLKNIRVLFFLGLNDGWIPKSSNAAGILSDMDRELLAKTTVELAPTARENGYIQRFYLYLGFTKPADRLFLSYSKSSMDGTPMRPSYVVNSILQMYHHILFTDEDICENVMERVLTPENGLQYLVDGFLHMKEEPMEAEWMELYNWYYQQEAYQDKVKALVGAAFLTRSNEGLDAQVAQTLYGNVLINSVSRLEKFAACAFAHFLQYGLRLNPREEYAFAPMDFGNVVHQVMELFSQKVEQSSQSWQELPEELAIAWADACVDEVTAEYGAGVLFSSSRNRYAILRLKRIMRRTVWALCEQIRSGDFIPDNYEVSFSMADDLAAVNIALTETEKMRLKGRIDRIDTCEKENQVYVKVIDYKSGNTDFDIAALYYGLQLQLVVYLNAALELEKRVYPDKEIVPAGILYYRVQDPVLNREGIEPEEVNHQILKQLKPSGLINENPEVIQAMDRFITKESSVIPVSYNKDSSPSRYSSVASKEQFDQLLSFVNQKMTGLGREIIHGKTEALPYERKGNTACQYCDYKEVCGFDLRIPGTKYQRLRDYKPEEIWKRIREEVES